MLQVTSSCYRTVI